MVHQHDLRYKKLFENHHLVAHLLKSFVDLKFIQDLDFSNMEYFDKSFIDENYKERESDKIYKIRFKGQEIFIYLLIEFQSTVDKSMPLRFLRYLLELTETYGKSKYTGLYPAIFPLLVYNGDAKWTTKRDISELFDKRIPDKFIPKFEYYPIIIKKIAKKDLLKIHNVVSAIFLIENNLTKEYHLLIEELVILMREALPDEIKSFSQWFNSVIKSRGIAVSKSALGRVTKSKEVSTMFETALDRIIENNTQIGLQKGMQQGLEEGIQQGFKKKAIETAVKMIAKGMDNNLIHEFTDLSIKEIEELRS